MHSRPRFVFSHVNFDVKKNGGLGSDHNCCSHLSLSAKQEVTIAIHVSDWFKEGYLAAF